MLVNICIDLHILFGLLLDAQSKFSKHANGFVAHCIANQNQMAVDADLTTSMLDANSGAYPFYCDSGATSHVSCITSAL